MNDISNFKMFDDEEEFEAPASSNIFMAKTAHNTVYTTSRTIAVHFNAAHKNILASIRKLIKNDTTGSAAKSFYETTYINKQNKAQPEFYVNQAGFQLLCLSKLLNDPVKREEFNSYFNYYNEKNRHELNNAIKEIEKLKAQLANTQDMSDDMILSKAVMIATDKINNQEKIIAEQAQQIEQKDQQLKNAEPDVKYAQAISTSTNNILIRQLANRINKALLNEGFKNNVGEKKLFEWLRQNSYLIRSPKSRDYNMPTKKSLDMGIMEGKLTPIEHKTIPGTWNSGTPEVTEKGAKYFTLKFLKMYQEGSTIEEGIAKGK